MTRADKLYGTLKAKGKYDSTFTFFKILESSCPHNYGFCEDDCRNEESCFKCWMKEVGSEEAMTSEEYNRINDVIEDLYEDGKLSEEDFDNLNKWIDNAFEYDKYQWHDLRKNPEDLPGKDGEYRCCITDGEDRHYFNCDYRNEIGWGTECVDWHDELPGHPAEYYFEPMDEDDEFKVIAWQEIDLFEEG